VVFLGALVALSVIAGLAILIFDLYAWVMFLIAVGLGWPVLALGVLP
jgi:hypothetical protein